MQKKQVKPVKQATKAKSATKTSSKAAAKPAAKAPAKAAAKPASKAAAKVPAKAPAKPAAKAPAKAAPTASSNVTKPTRGAKAAPTQATMQAAARAASAATVGPRHRRDDRSADIPKPKQAPAVAPAIPSRAFSFEDAGRTFNCRVEPLRPSGTDAWWWFEVSTEQHQRHAPFRAEGDDTQEQVRARMVKYYDELLARRAEPAPNRWNRRPSSPGTPAVTAPAEDAEDAEGVDDAEGADLDGEEPNGDEPEMVDLSEAEGIAEESTT